MDFIQKEVPPYLAKRGPCNNRTNVATLWQEG